MDQEQRSIGAPATVDVEFVSDKPTFRRLIAAYFRWNFLHTWAGRLALVFVVGWLLWAWLYAAPEVGALIPTLYTVGLPIAFSAVQLGMAYLAIKPIARPGLKLVAHYRADAFDIIVGSDEPTTYRYARIQKVNANDSLVFLHLAGGAIPALPRAVVPDAALDLMRTAITH